MYYVNLNNLIGVPKHHHEGRLMGKGTLGKKSMIPDPDVFQKAHFLVLQQMSEVSEYIDEHKMILKRQNPELTDSLLAKEHMRTFSYWF